MAQADINDILAGVRDGRLSVETAARWAEMRVSVADGDDGDPDERRRLVSSSSSGRYRQCDSNCGTSWPTPAAGS